MEQLKLKEMGGGVEGDKSSLMVLSQAKMLLWMTRGMTSLLLWICVVQLLTVGEVWGPRLLKTWPSCYQSTPNPQTNIHSSSLSQTKVFLSPKSKLFSFLNAKIYIIILFYTFEWILLLNLEFECVEWI